MAKKGKTPSLIGVTLGASHFITTKGKRKCNRCDNALPKGTNFIEVSIPNTVGYKNFCKDCYERVLNQTQKELDGLRVKLSNH